MDATPVISFDFNDRTFVMNNISLCVPIVELTSAVLLPEQVQVIHFSNLIVKYGFTAAGDREWFSGLKSKELFLGFLEHYISAAEDQVKFLEQMQEDLDSLED